MPRGFESEGTEMSAGDYFWSRRIVAIRGDIRGVRYFSVINISGDQNTNCSLLWKQSFS